MTNKVKSKCPTCGEVFSNDHGMKIHHSRKHGESIAGISVNCAVCGQKVTRRPYRIENGRKNFCSDECTEEYNKHTQGYTTAELLDEVERLHKELGKVPSISDLEEHGQISQHTYYSHFEGGWNAVISEAGLEPNTRSLSKQDCIEDIRKTEKKLSRIPTTDDQERCGEVCVKTFYKFFDSWREVVSSAGLDASKVRGRNLPISEKKGHPDYGPNWQIKREEALSRDNYCCQRCGLERDSHEKKYGRDLEVHHITPARKYDDYEEQNDISNLITLCMECHREWEALPIQPQISEVAD